MNQGLHELEYTGILSNGDVPHYTCNSPSQEVLDYFGILAIGDRFNRDPREFLIIPSAVFEGEGIPIPQDENILTINAENLMKRLRIPQ